MKYGLLVITILAACGSVVAQRIIDPYRFANPCATAQMLDLITNQPVTAYSITRKLRAAYSGACFQARRTSDSTLQDIGFTSDCRMDTNALLTFAGANTVTVNILYDQSASGTNLVTGAGLTELPIIVNAGVLQVDANGFPTMRFDGVGDGMTTATLVILLPVTRFSVWSMVTHADNSCIEHGASTTQAAFSVVTSGGQKVELDSGSSLVGVVYSTGTQYLSQTYLESGTSDSITLNNGSATVGSAGNNGYGAVAVGHIGGAPFSPHMDFSEDLVFNHAITGTSLTIIQANMNAFYTLW